MKDEEMAEESLISYRKEPKWAGKMFMQDENTCYIDGFLAGLKAQVEIMKVCSNCKHFNNLDDLEYCQNCERQLVNSLDKLPREEIIKDEWELKE